MSVNTALHHTAKPLPAVEVLWGKRFVFSGHDVFGARGLTVSEAFVAT